MKFRFATRVTPPAVAEARLIPEPNPLVPARGQAVPFYDTPEKQLLFIRHLFGCPDPQALNAFAQLSTDRMEALLVQMESEHLAATTLLAELEDQAATIRERVGKGAAMIREATLVTGGADKEWLDLMTTLEAEAERLATAISGEQATLARLNSLYPAALSWYQVQAGGDALEEYAPSEEA